jgi:hypothetical protein
MPRWGEGSVKGTKQKDSRNKGVERAYVGSAAAGGVGLGVGGGHMMRTGRKQERVQTERVGRINTQITRESQVRNANSARIRPSWHIATQESKKIDELANRPAVQRANRAAQGYDRNAPRNIRNLQMGRLTQARRTPGYEAAELEGNMRRTQIDAEMHKIRPLREANAYSETKSKALRANRGKAQAAAAAGAKRFGRGRKMAIGAAALPLAALATHRMAGRTANQGKRDFSPTPRTTPQVKPSSYQPSKPDTHGMNRAERAKFEAGDFTEAKEKANRATPATFNTKMTQHKPLRDMKPTKEMMAARRKEALQHLEKPVQMQAAERRMERYFPGGNKRVREMRGAD